ncbi:hypothetical protein NZD89_18505 [Alicyclobacillus fastidiosus]|uniref:Uncharacterized protein n=1 Tax=Alicyclobacillus fastidiosus TaxID=392011 RepID=A0ABY6ZDT8_9BACL|nr:hypothetical protein [Alicyclobacillus fastidiosus]WAH40349.1 hypothetical protein NZD89_18505 [Alicyclobacillus fastidiosus]
MRNQRSRFTLCADSSGSFGAGADGAGPFYGSRLLGGSIAALELYKSVCEGSSGIRMAVFNSSIIAGAAGEFSRS